MVLFDRSRFSALRRVHGTVTAATLAINPWAWYGGAIFLGLAIGLLL